MKQYHKHHITNKRNSSIELLKIVGIILVVVSHVIQTLHANNAYIINNDYIIDISIATTNIQILLLAIFRYSGSLGNSIFFLCSAWFLLESNEVNKKKLLHILLNTWFISLSILALIYILKCGDIPFKMFIKQFLPTTFCNNWYITCYVLFYSLHPLLNKFIRITNQKNLLKISLTMLIIYVGINFILPETFYSSNIVLWITLYFTMAYIKYYLIDLSNNIRINIIAFLIGALGNIGVICFTNFLGLHFSMFSNWLLRWNTNCNPFLLLMAFSMLNLAKNIYFENKTINYVSGLSFLIYIIHENQLLRIFYRPLLWNYVYIYFGYDKLLIWTFILVLIVFSFSLITSTIYKKTIEKLITISCDWIYLRIQKIYNKIETIILRLH